MIEQVERIWLGLDVDSRTLLFRWWVRPITMVVSCGITTSGLIRALPKQSPCNLVKLRRAYLS